MATNTFVEIDIPEAANLADLTGISHDLESAKQFATQLKEMLSREPPDYSLIEPMTIAILVRYSRPFTTGVRRWFGEAEIETLSPKQKTAHERFRLWRDKHIAHSVNVFEDNQPIARYWVERFDDEGFTSVECNSTQLIGLSAYDIEMILELTTHFLEEIKPRLKIEKERVLEIVRSLPREEVLAMKKPASAPHITDVGKVRKRLLTALQLRRGFSLVLKLSLLS